jgi:hypothetical protein
MVGENPSLNRTGQYEGLVTENIKTLRLLHQLLMVVSAAILAFALRPDQSKDYKAALNELSTLKEISFDGWGKFIMERYQADEDHNQNFVLGIIHRAGLPIQGSPRLGQDIYGDQPPYIGNASLNQVDAFISGSRKIGAITMNGSEQNLGEQLKRAVATRNGNPVVSGMWLSGFGTSEIPLVNGIRMLDWRNPSPAPTAVLNFNINDQPQTVPNQPVYVIATYTIHSEDGPFSTDWLKADTFGQNLFDLKTGTVFPNLKKYWDKVNSLPVDQAAALLQQLESSTHHTIAFFGIQVESTLAISAGPVVCFSILLFLCLHLRHFRSIAVGSDAIKLFPWVPFFRGVWGLGVAYLTILALPAIANASLLLRFGRWPDVSTQFGIAFRGLILGTGVWAMHETRRLRKQSSA